MSRCHKHRDMVIDDCPGCLIEKNARVARQLKHPKEVGAYWECHGCGHGEPMATPCRATLVGRPSRCLRDLYMKAVWTEVKA